MVNIISLATGSGPVEPPEDEMAAFTEFVTNPYRIHSGGWPDYLHYTKTYPPTQDEDGVEVGSWSVPINVQGTGANTWHAEIPYLLVDTGNGVNAGKLFAEGKNHIRRPGLIDDSFGMDSSSNWLWRFRKIWGGYIAGNNFGLSIAVTSPTNYVGFGQGWHTTSGFATATTPYLDPPEDDFVHMRIRGDIMKWELVVGVVGVGTTITQLSGTEDPSPAIVQVVWFEWMPPDPMGTGGPFVRAYVNGVLGAEITDPDLLPGQGELDFWGPGAVYNHFFCMTGDPGGSDVGYCTGRFGPMFAQEFGVPARGA